MSTHLDIRDEPSLEEQNQLIAKLIEYNESKAGPRNFQRLGVFARDEDGILQGGIVATILWTVCFIERLWVAESQRGQRLGSRLLETIESICRERGCSIIHVDTFSFQAPGFYEKKGFELFGTIPDCPPGHKRRFFVKRLIH